MPQIFEVKANENVHYKGNEILSIKSQQFDRTQKRMSDRVTQKLRPQRVRLELWMTTDDNYRIN